MRLLATAQLALFCAAAGCSGAASTDLFDPGNTASGDDPITENPSTTLPAPAQHPVVAGTSSPSPSDTTTTPPTVTTPPDDPPVVDPPAEVCVVESEPNNDIGNATPFDTCLGGIVSSRTDVDWGTFTVPAAAKKISWTTDGGNVTVLVTTGKLVDPLPIQNGGTVQSGQKLYVQLSALGGGKPAYAVHFTFQ